MKRILKMQSLYNSLRRRRDWVLGKIEYLQTESAKWRTLFKVIASPYSLLRALGLSPQMATGLLFAGTVAGSGVAVNETVFADRSFERGDSGVYAANPEEGWSDIPFFYSDETNTLRLDLAAIPIGEITIEDITVGTFTGSTLPSGKTNVVEIGGLPSSSGFSPTYLEVGHLTIDRWKCNKLTLSDMEVYDLRVTHNASDGQSFGAVPGVHRSRGIGGGNRAEAMKTDGGYYDMLVVQAPSSGTNGKVDILNLVNIYTSGGPCIVRRIKAGIVEIKFNEFGSGDGLGPKDFIIEDSVSFQKFTNTGNVEVAISPPS